MIKCCTCNRPIKNPHYLDGEIYGHECYKLALALKYIHLQEMKNDDYIKQCVAAIEVFQNTEFTKCWNKDFQKSILNQWNSCYKLTGKQLNVIKSKIDLMEYEYIYFALLDEEEKQLQQARHITNWTVINNQLEKYKNDERLHEAIKIEKSNSINRHNKTYYIVKWKDIDDDESLSIYEIINNNQLEKYKNDEYLDILEIIEVK